MSLFKVKCEARKIGTAGDPFKFRPVSVQATDSDHAREVAIERFKANGYEAVMVLEVTETESVG